MGREDYSVFHLGDFVLSSGAILKNAFLAYQTYGDPKHPALVYPTPFGASKSVAPCCHPQWRRPRSMTEGGVFALQSPGHASPAETILESLTD